MLLKDAAALMVRDPDKRMSARELINSGMIEITELTNITELMFRMTKSTKVKLPTLENSSVLIKPEISAAATAYYENLLKSQQEKLEAAEHREFLCYNEKLCFRVLCLTFG